MEFDRLVVSFMVDEVVGGFFISVPPGHIACVYDRGRGVLPRVWGPGLHLKLPFWQVAKLFNAQILEFSVTEGFDSSKNKEALGDLPVFTTTQDGREISIQGSILFRIDRDNAPELWENIGENVVSKVVRPFSRSRISSVFASLTLEEIKQNRNRVEQIVKEDLSQHFQNRGLECEGFLLSEVKMVTSRGGEVTILRESEPQVSSSNGMPVLERVTERMRVSSHPEMTSERE
ncbi:MAG: SPFH domain-containing protein [bacterium]|nr:SPFH domain-containing protein [bacterium]